MLKNLSRYNQKFLNNFSKKYKHMINIIIFNISHAIKQSFGCLPPYIFIFYRMIKKP